MAEHVSDFTQASKQIVLDLINGQNPGANLVLEKFDFSAITATGGNGGKQVELTVTSKRGSGYRGSQTFNYNRLFLNEMPGIVKEETLERDLLKLSDILTFINETFGMNIDASDVLVNGTDLDVSDPDIEQVFDQAEVFTIEARPTSYVWLGDLMFSLTKVRSDLNDLIVVRVLDGLIAPFDAPDQPIMIDENNFVRTREDGSIRIMSGQTPALPPA